ncbi:MAG: DEAD/DEAH box helicase, partial [Catenulispora sp.]|nr:DEAD/DEAH box helicase [Catenulispora sp.]
MTDVVTDEIIDGIAGAEAADETTDADTDTTDAAFADGEPVAFTELGLPEKLVKKLAENGVHTAFPIQAATIPDALAGRHVLGKARTGSGKTLAFGLAALANLNGKRARKGKPLALVLVPTRELAMQVSDALEPYGYAVGADIAAVYGGAPMYKQVFALRRGVELLVATPGRLTDLIEQEECDLSEVAIAILDEADQMADMGFMPIVSELLSQTDPAGQRLLFSATLDGAVDELVRQYMSDPVVHSVTEDDEEPIRMDHHLLIVEPTEKALITAEIAARHTPGDDARRTILFARTKLGADRIAEKIREHGVSALALHGGMTQRARTKTLADFKDGRVPVLVATDVAARGIHVDGIDLVLHVDPAGDPKDYLHRAGRTARAGESGTVVTLVLPKQRKSTLRLLEQAGVEAELTKVAPSSDTLRSLTGGRPVAEYVAEADA